MTKTTKQKRVNPHASALGKLGGAVRGKCKGRGTAHARRIALLRWMRWKLRNAEATGKPDTLVAHLKSRVARLEQKNGN